MFNLIINKFIKDADKVEDAKVRESYGVLTSIFSIVLNGIMVIFKILFGYLTASVAIMADGFNNLSDMGSNLATLFGFKLASKHPDSDHPYGHGRIEYIVGMIISFLILFVGFSSLKESINKIISPEEIIFSFNAVIVLVVSILIKLWMGMFNGFVGKKIDSSSLMAASKDSYNDVMSTFATLVSLILVLFINFPLDGYIGAVVSVLVIKSGIEIFKSTMDPLLGMAPDKELVKELEDYIMSYDVAYGIHDLIMHDYGPGNKFMTLHVEVDSRKNIMVVHDQIDLIERNILQEFGILTTIHMDPIDCDDEKTNELKEMVNNVVKEINARYTIHDFRIVSGPSHTNLIFDLVLPSDDLSDHLEIKKEVNNRIKALNSDLYCVIEVEHSYA